MQVVLIQYVNRGKILKTNDKKKIENENNSSIITEKFLHHLRFLAW